MKRNNLLTCDVSETYYNNIQTIYLSIRQGIIYLLFYLGPKKEDTPLSTDPPISDLLLLIPERFR